MRGLGTPFPHRMHMTHAQTRSAIAVAASDLFCHFTQESGERLGCPTRTSARPQVSSNIATAKIAPKVAKSLLRH